MPAPVPSRPQTLREAKKAYRKAAGNGISDVDLRRLQRASALDKRAERIKAKEKQRGINRQKKEEKEKKEKESRRRLENVETLDLKICAGQARIASFLGRKPVKIEDGGEKDIFESKHKRITNMEKNHPQRQPLQKINLNKGHARSQGLDSQPPMKKPLAAITEDDTDWTRFLASSTQIERDISYVSPSNSRNSQSPSLALPTGENCKEGPEHDSTAATAEDKGLPNKFPTLSECALISTQDLEFTSEDLQELESPITNQEIPVYLTPDLSFTDEDLLDLDSL